MGFFDPWNKDGVSVHSGGISRPSNSRRQSSRSHHKKHRSRSRSRSSSRNRKSSGRSIAGSLFGGGDRDRDRDRHDKHNVSRGSFFGGDKYDKHNASRGSFFGGDKYEKHNSSKSSFFGLGGNGSRSSFFGGNRSSYYKRSPRQGFVQRTYKQLKRLLRDLVHWAKRHPWKVFFLVIMPLVTGGALTALLARFGLRMPKGLVRMLGMASKAASGDSIGMVGEAVRMASGFGGDGGSVKVKRTREMDYGRDEGWGGGMMGGGGGGGGGFMGGGGLMDMAKKFM
ncbi:hypothetical protein G7046_g25 [Stylonectria norvegica]|nr:hypothetical protein G7046_g25 [Stylonectria norvegica]